MEKSTANALFDFRLFLEINIIFTQSIISFLSQKTKYIWLNLAFVDNYWTTLALFCIGWYNVKEVKATPTKQKSRISVA